MLKAVARAVVEAEAVVMGCVWVCEGERVPKGMT